MPRLIRISALAALAIALTIGTSSAATMQWGAQAFGGFNTHSMSDWNDIIDQANEGGAANFDNITSGISFGVGPTVVVNGRWMFGAHYEMITPKKSSDQGTEIKLKANAFGVSGAYLFPSTSPLSFGLGVSVDEMQLAGQLNSTTSDNDINGSGIGFLINGLADYAFSPMFSGQASVGYRIADIDIDDIGGQDVSASDLHSEDYSGVAIRVGISLHQPKK